MGSATSRGDYMKLTPEQRALVKRVWIGVEHNPQFHGSDPLVGTQYPAASAEKLWLFGFCDIYPQYIKYFTSEPRIPLTFDSRTNAKFTIIIETMGYLLLDFHDKPKQLDQLIGYIAMVHKDMNLERSDMFNFGLSLLEYLTMTFPALMTPESIEVISKYMNNLLGELSQKIEHFKKAETSGKSETHGKRKTSCGDYLLCRDGLIYGQTASYWRERKSKWDERLHDWRLHEPTAVDPFRTSSTDEEEVALRSRTEDEASEFAESTARLLESHGIPRKTKTDLALGRRQSSLNAPAASSSRRSTSARTRRAFYQQKVRDETLHEETSSIPETSAVPVLTPRERRRNSRAPDSRNEVEAPSVPAGKPRSMAGERGESSRSRPAETAKIDSLARRRRRASQERSSSSPSPSVYF